MRKLTVAEDSGLGILFAESYQQLVERVLLSLGSRIVRDAFVIKAALIADTDGTVVVVAGMYALHRLRQKWNDIAISTNIVVVGHLAEPSLTR